LDLSGAANRIHHARKLDQHAVAGGLDDATVVLSDLGVAELVAMRLQAFERSFLVNPHQARVARDGGGEDRSQATGCGHRYSSGIPALRNPAK